MYGNNRNGEDVSPGRVTTDETIAEIFHPGRQTGLSRPLYACGVSAGFPSPADDYIDRSLDLNELLIPHPAATFFVRVAGDSMTGAFLNHDDILVVDRSLEASDGSIVIAVVDGELTVKRLRINENGCRLVAENPDYPEVGFTDNSSCEVWGVVRAVVHTFI